MTISKFSTTGMNEKVQKYANSLQGEFNEALLQLSGRASATFGGQPEAIYNTLAAASSVGEVFEVREGDSTLALFGLVVEPHRGLLTLFASGPTPAFPLQNAIDEISEYIFSLGVPKIEAQVTVNEAVLFGAYMHTGTLHASRLIDGQAIDTVMLERFRNTKAALQFNEAMHVAAESPKSEKCTKEELAYADENDLDLPRRTSPRLSRDTGLALREAPSREEANAAPAVLGLAPIDEEEAPARKVVRWDPLANEPSRSIRV